MATRKLKSGAEAHKFTPEDSAKGGRARAEKFRQRREAAERAADEQLVAGLAKALARLEGLLDSENQQVAFRAVREYLDRALGRSAQRVEPEVDMRERIRREIRAEIEAETAAGALAAREKLGRLIESRTRALAEGEG